MVRDLQVKTVSRNLLRKYGLGPHKEQTGEQGGQVQDGQMQETGIGGTGGPRQAGRTVMTKERKEMIKGGSFIALGWQVHCSSGDPFYGFDPFGVLFVFVLVYIVNKFK